MAQRQTAKVDDWVDVDDWQDVTPAQESIKPFESPKYGPTGPSAGEVASEQAASVLRGIPQAVTSLPAAAKEIGLTAWDFARGKLMPGAKRLGSIASGMAQPLTTTARGVGALIAPDTISAPSEEDFTRAAEGSGALLAGAEIPNIVRGAVKAAPVASGAVARASGAVARKALGAVTTPEALESAAATSKAQALKPVGLEAQAAAQRIAPEASRRGLFSGIRSKTIDRNVKAELDRAGQMVSKAEARLSSDVRPEAQIAKAPILQEMDDILRGLDPDIFPEAVSQIQRLRGAVNRLPEYASFDRVIKLRRDLDTAVDQMGGFKGASASADRIKVVTTRGVSDILRRQLNDLDPSLKAANHEFWLARKASDIVSRRELGDVGKMGTELPGRGSLLDDIIATGTGSAIAGAPGAIAAEAVNLGRQLRGYANVKSSLQQKLADFLKKPKPPETRTDRLLSGMTRRGQMAGTNRPGVDVPQYGPTLQGGMKDTSAVKGVPGEFAKRPIKGLLTEGARITPPPPDPSRLVIWDAKRRLARDPKTGRIFRYYTSD